MNPERIAVLGGYGQLGSDLVPVFQERGLRVFPLGRADVDCTDPEAVSRTLRELRPDVVVNCAAFVRVDDCEDRPLEAFRVNALGALYVARACADARALCVYISTDYVFDGRKGAPYTEEDRPNPLNVYGMSKWAGELLVRCYAPEYLIVRTSGLYGLRGSRGKGGNFVETILRLAREGKPLRVVDDQRLTPTYTRDLARALGDLLSARGLYHVTNTGECSWYEFAVKVLEGAGVQADVTPISTAAFGARALRPAYSVLASEGLRRLGYPPLQPWPEALRAYLDARQTAALEAASARPQTESKPPVGLDPFT